jgi:LPXTG-motif cell wall-anchored protein
MTDDSPGSITLYVHIAERTTALAATGPDAQTALVAAAIALIAVGVVFVRLRQASRHTRR